MAIKIPVVDRVSTHPGRVVLTPVSGQTNTYDMKRADVPTVEGTPVDKKLFDNKAYTLTADVTVYVSTAGNDVTGDGTNTAPYATIQKAVDSLPKWLDGHTATIDIAEGTYEGRITISGFQGGKLVLGAAGRAVTVRGIQVKASSNVVINVAEIIRTASVTGTLLYVQDNSNVRIGGRLAVDGQSASITGVMAEHHSTISVVGEAILIVRSCGYNAVLATSGSRIALYGIAGAGSGVGLRAEYGGVITYTSRSITATTDNATVGGGRIYSGAQASIPSY